MPCARPDVITITAFQGPRVYNQLRLRGAPDAGASYDWGTTMPEDRNSSAVRDEVLRIAAGRGPARFAEYTVREYPEPGSIPNWFMGVIFLLKDEIGPDEKIVIQEGVIKIARKTAIDKLLDWVRRQKKAQDIDEKVPEGELPH